MLGVILFILKLLGVLLLAIFCLIFLILFLILFAPVRYNGQGSKYGEALKVQALITYLNPIIRVRVSYPSEAIVQVKVLGFTVLRIGQEKEEPHEETKSKKKKADEKQSSTVVTGEQPVSNDSQIPKAKEKEQIPIAEASAAEEGKEEAVADSTKNSTFDTVRYYSSVFQENKGLILNVLKTVLKALKTILPRKCDIDITFGTGQADTTGFIYAVYCSLQEYFSGRIIFNPVWTERFAEGQFLLKGRIRMIHFATAAVKIILNKDVRLLYKKIRRV